MSVERRARQATEGLREAVTGLQPELTLPVVLPRARRRVAIRRASGAVVALGITAAAVWAGLGIPQTRPGVRVAASHQVDGEPGAVAAGHGAIWVVDASHGGMVVLDPLSVRVDATIRLDPSMTDVLDVQVTDEHVWVQYRRFPPGAASSEIVMAKVDPASRRVAATLDVPSFDGPVVVHRDEIWSTSGDVISRHGVTTGAPGGRVRVPSRPRRLAAGGGAVWVASAGSGGEGVVARIDEGGEPTAVTQLDGSPSAIAVGEGAVWVATLHGYVLRIDPTEGGVTAAVEVGALPAAIAVEGGLVWVANAGDGTVSRIDATTLNVRTSRRLGGIVADVAVGEGGVWAVLPREGRVVRLDPAG